MRACELSVLDRDALAVFDDGETLPSADDISVSFFAPCGCSNAFANVVFGWYVTTE